MSKVYIHKHDPMLWVMYDETEIKEYFGDDSLDDFVNAEISEELLNDFQHTYNHLMELQKILDNTMKGK